MKKDNELDDFLVIDTANFELKNVIGQFMKAISKEARTKKPEYIFGQMNNILQ